MCQFLWKVLKKRGRHFFFSNWKVFIFYWFAEVLSLYSTYGWNFAFYILTHITRASTSLFLYNFYFILFTAFRNCDIDSFLLVQYVWQPNAFSCIPCRDGKVEWIIHFTCRICKVEWNILHVECRICKINLLQIHYTTNTRSSYLNTLSAFGPQMQCHLVAVIVPSIIKVLHLWGNVFFFLNS